MAAEQMHSEFERSANCDPVPRSRLLGPIDGREVAQGLLQREQEHTRRLLEQINIEREKRGEKPVPIHYPAADNGERRRMTDKDADPVNKPTHYRSHASGVECITITEHMNFCLGNAVKYIWRGAEDLKGEGLRDLEKAAWYINREIERRKKAA